MPKKNKMNINSKKMQMISHRGIYSTNTKMPNTTTGKASKNIRSTRPRPRGNR